MEKMFSKLLSSGLILLTLTGFTKDDEPKHMLGLMNVDTQHSVIRVPLTLALLYAGSNHAPLRSTRTVLTGVGVFYLAMGAAGAIDRKVGGTLPSKLTTFDLVYHFGTGSLAIWLGSRTGRMMKG